MVERLWRLLPPAWLGVLLAIALVAAPAAFGALAPAEAGKVVARLFAREAVMSLAFGLVFLLVERRRGGAPMGANMLFALGAMFCTVAGYYALLPLMDEARAGRGAFTFGQLHAASLAFYGVKTALVAALTWRATGVSAPVRSS